MKKFGGTILAWILILVVGGAIGWLYASAGRVIGDHNNTQRKADISLNDYVNNGQEFPVGKYVSLDVRWVLGPYATYTHTSTTNSTFTATSSVEYYYLVMLENDTFMSLCTRNAAERETLDRMAAWLLRVDGFPMNGETLKVQGNLKNLTEQDLKKYYNEFLTECGVSLTDSRIRYIVLDTTAGREGLYLYIFGGIAVVALILFIRKKMKKKESAPSPYENNNGSESF